MELTHENALFRDEDVDKDEDEEDDTAVWEDWNDYDDDNGDGAECCVCILCPMRFSSSDHVFKHCFTHHSFDFSKLRKLLRLDFYGCFKFINYLRSQVAESRCWVCGSVQESNEFLLKHLQMSGHSTPSAEQCSFSWQDDRYLTPFFPDDPLLYNFEFEEEDTVEQLPPMGKEELLRELGEDSLANLKCLVESLNEDQLCKSSLNPAGHSASRLSDTFNVTSGEGKYDLNKNYNDQNQLLQSVQGKRSIFGNNKDKKCKVTFAKVAEREIEVVNEGYFSSYGGYSIHREMLSDQVRMDAYREAILKNPSLFKGAVVMDVGCGTGILSLFAAQAGASEVFAVEASQKMASVARQVAKDNKMLRVANGDIEASSGVVTVVEGMVEKLDDKMPTVEQSVDVILSEWMGYCLLYESMLSSVLYARDRWLKPGGAILPDTAKMFVAGFGKGGTSLPFWENVCGFNMSSIGKELLEDAAQQPIVDVVQPKDIVTETSILRVFDLVTMNQDEMDFTTDFHLKPKPTTIVSNKDSMMQDAIWCYGLVLWFETEFTARFCREVPTVLSTSPYSTKTHWSQTILTFKDPIALLSHPSKKTGLISVQEIGTEFSPATTIKGRLSIARSYKHRSIDISVELVAVGENDLTRVCPVQIFDL